ncbi:MAG TPA: type II CAAX endopeptidase family protein, partial [Planctomycetota bacterium]|nr:type II CAAX endopeptidase family protein [Planctomycetota bacterium]
RERRAILLGIGMLVLVYYLGSWLQTRSWISFELGLLATLWGVVALPAILYALLAKKRAKELLGLHVPRVADGIAAFAIAFAAILLMASWSSVQETILPVPSAVREEFERMRTSIAALGPVTAFLVLALSPGIAEELFWRGAFQGELEARGRPVRVVAWSALFFGLFHLSIYRFVPTAFMGGLLAIVRLRTGSVIPCMVLHTTYNALNLFVVSRWTEAGLELGAWLVPVLILLLVLGLRALGPRRTRATAD